MLKKMTLCFCVTQNKVSKDKNTTFKLNKTTLKLILASFFCPNKKNKKNYHYFAKK